MSGKKKIKRKKNMKIVAIVGSPRKKGNTSTLLSEVCKGAQEMGFETEIVFLSDYALKDCIGCEGCSKTGVCVVQDDMQTLYKKIKSSDALILGSPTYFYNVSGLMKSFLDRLYSFEFFDDEDRSVWLSYNEVFGLKYAVTVAVCEQLTLSDMGVTSDMLSQTLSAVGWRSVANIKALHAFKQGEALKNTQLLQECYQAGLKLAKTVILSNKIKKRQLGK